MVAAHPDDIEFSCAGTVAGWTDAGVDVTFCLVTDGSTGTQDRSIVGESLASLRKTETEAAAAVLGVNKIEWLGYRDGYLEYTLDLRRDIARMFRKHRPHRFLVLDPASTIEDRFINHPDHRAAGQASLDVAMTAGTTPGHFPELLDEGFEPWRGLRETWIMGPARGSHVVDITSTLERKIDALMCHKSQVGEDRAEIEGWLKEYLAEIGRSAGFEYGESFRVIAEGPGFHADEQDEVDFEPVKVTRAPADPRSAPT